MVRLRKGTAPLGPRERLLEALGAVSAIPPDGGGFWVYGLRRPDGETFYVGKSASLLTRLGHWRRVHGDAMASVWLVPCESEWQMEVTEEFLIDRFQPAMNVRGVAGEAARVRAAALSRRIGPVLAGARTELRAVAGE